MFDIRRALNYAVNGLDRRNPIEIMAKEIQYREGTLGWWLIQAGWTPVEVPCRSDGNHKKDAHGKCEKCRQFPHPLWRFAEFELTVTGWEARRLELLKIHNEFKARANDYNKRLPKIP